MDVGFVVSGELSTTTGGFIYDRNLVHYLRSAGDAVEVIEIPWRAYPVGLVHNLDPRLRRRVAAPDVDVLVQDELCHPSLVLTNRGREVPVVSIVHHLRSSEPRPSVPQSFVRVVEAGYLRSVDGFIWSSEATRDAVQSLGGRSTGIVAYPGGDRLDADPDRFDIDGRAHRGRFSIVFLGRVTPRKGLHTLIQGLSRLPDDSWQLTAIGDTTASPRYVAEVRHQIEELGLEHAIDMQGKLDDHALSSTLADCHLLAVPSTYEGFGIAYLEGMGFGLPALATTAGGASELVRDGEDGILVPPNDPAAIAAAIEPLVTDRNRLARMGRKARRRFESHPTWEETAERVRDFLLGFVDE